MCIDRLERGDKPICVLSCSLRALEFGPIEELREQFGNLSQLEDLPKDTLTHPAVVFKPVQPKKPVVPWDYQKALKLWQKRHPDNGQWLPDIFEDASEVTQPLDNLIGRNRLVLKAQNTRELMWRTMDDE